MAKTASWSKTLIPLGIIAVISVIVAGGVMAAAGTAGFGASVLVPERTNEGMRFGLFRTRWCGNGIVEHREQCDDGNRVSGDGCSKRCKNDVAGCFGHAVGERFRSPDGCNTCVCTKDGAACTKMACIPSSSSSAAPVGKKCMNSDMCASGEYCTTEDGDCESSCPPGAEACIQVCSGRCRSAQCRPYECSDGSRHPSCTPDGHVINYFADPCLTSRPPVCGNGRCEATESAQKCDPAAICRKPHYCPQDCGSASSASSLSCAQLKQNFDAVVANNRICSTDSDCVLFEASCPYVTCGVAIHKNASGDAQAAADAYTQCQQNSGEPVSCAGCIMQSVACVNNRCVTR